MAVLVGSTGFVGGHISRHQRFDVAVHRPNVTDISGVETDLLVCAGLPAEKWRANKDPRADWENMAELAQVLATVRAESAVLMSTIDVYEPAAGVDENDPARLNGPGAYGAHRAWFETFFRARFPDSLVLRLPALYAADVRKNLVHDLLRGKRDQLAGINPISTFQFFDVTRAWELVRHAWSSGIRLMNVTSEPVTADQIANLFGVTLTATGAPARYDVRSIHAGSLGGREGYMFDQQSILADIAELGSAASTP